MTPPRDPDPLAPGPHHEPDDHRDEVLARALAVAPLDEVTRARLLRRTLDEVAPAGALADQGARRYRRAYLVASAAAAVLVLAVAVGVGVGDDARSRPTAVAPATSEKDRVPAEAPPAAGRSERTLASDRELGPAPTNVRDLGDLGPVDDLDRVVVPALDSLPFVLGVTGSCGTGPRPEILAEGRGTREGMPVRVEIRRTDDARRRLVVVSGCTVVDARSL